MKEFKINEQILRATLNYLVSKPFQEVSNLVEALKRLPVIEEEKEDKKKKK